MSASTVEYSNLPTLHITLEVIDNPNLDKLDEVLKKIFKPYKRFKVELNDVVYFEEPHKSINFVKVFNISFQNKSAKGEICYGP